MKAKAYLAGCVVGDAWCTPLTLGMRVKDEDFSRAFADAIKEAFGVSTRVAKDERGYWLVRIGNRTERFKELVGYQPSGKEEMGAWVRGLFDSEGNACLSKSNVSKNAWNRRVAIYSTNAATLERAALYLLIHGVMTKVYVENPSAGHKGTKPVMQLRVIPNRWNYWYFATRIGSSIARKQAVLDAIPSSYQPDGHHGRAGKLGSAVRLARRAKGEKY